MHTTQNALVMQQPMGSKCLAAKVLWVCVLIQLILTCEYILPRLFLAMILLLAFCENASILFTSEYTTSIKKCKTQDRHHATGADLRRRLVFHH